MTQKEAGPENNAEGAVQVAVEEKLFIAEEHGGDNLRMTQCQKRATHPQSDRLVTRQKLLDAGLHR